MSGKEDLQQELIGWLNEQIEASNMRKELCEGLPTTGKYYDGEAFAYAAAKRKVEYFIDIAKEMDSGT